jgi:hypothetical protein
MDDTSQGLPSVAELPEQMKQLLDSDNTGMMSHLRDKAAEAAAATQVLHVLQQQEAQAVVKSAELAASSLAAERRLAEAVRAEAQAAGVLLEVEQAAKVGSHSRSSNGRSSNSRGRGDTAVMSQLETARKQLEESAAARAAAQAQLQELKSALAREQKQVRPYGYMLHVPFGPYHMCRRRTCMQVVHLFVLVFVARVSRGPNACHAARLVTCG